MVGEGVFVTVAVNVIVGVGVGSTAACVGRVARYTIPAPIARKSKNKPRIVGRLKVTCGSLLP
jgi:hypothetical protein